MGADFIEPDLVATKDGQLVARHEPEIGGTTDVADQPEFAGRRTTKVIDGASRTGWFTDDFTLAELKTLRAKERIPDVRPRNAVYDGRFPVPTFAEVLDLRARLSEELRRPIGIVPEIKHSSYFAAQDLAIGPRLVQALRDAGLDTPGAPVVVQSFQTRDLAELRGEIEVPLLALLGARGDRATPAGLRDIARYADWVGPPTATILPTGPTGEWERPTPFVRDAHAAGLKVAPYTLRNENRYLPPHLRSSADPNAHGDALACVRRFFELGVDGVFTDNPDTAVAARAAWRAGS